MVSCFLVYLIPVLLPVVCEKNMMDEEIFNGEPFSQYLKHKHRIRRTLEVRLCFNPLLRSVPNMTRLAKILIKEGIIK